MRSWVVAAVSALGLALLAAGEVHAQHSEAQAARIAELQPDSVMINRNSDKVYIRGGHLGRFGAGVSPEENLRNLIGRLGLLHEAARSAQFSVAEQMPRFVRFVQLIGGVPVSGRVEVDLDADGRILEARLSVVDPARAPKAQALSRERALQIAALACAAKAGVTAAEVSLEDFPGLHYQPTAQGEPLKLQYGFAARAGNEADTVTVDALTGAVTMTSTYIPMTG
jgi:hypothetical protein